MTSPNATRGALVRRGLWLNYGTIAYNSLEAVVSLVAGVMAGSVALVGFGIDSVIEVTASGAAQWRLRADVDHIRRERVERITLRVIGLSFLALAAYVGVDAGRTLWLRERPERSLLGLAILVLSVVIMPVLARAKRPGRGTHDGTNHRKGRRGGHRGPAALRGLSLSRVEQRESSAPLHDTSRPVDGLLTP